MPVQSKLRWFIKISLSALAYAISLWLCLGLVFAFLISDRVARRAVSPDTVNKMHFFVICDNKSKIILSAEVEKAVKESACSFNIPINQVEYWNQELKNTVEANSSSSWKLAVKQLTETKQEVRIQHSNGDVYFFSWYEVEGRKVTPKYLKTIHMGYGFIAAGLSGVIWLIGLWLVRKLYRKFRFG